MGSMQINLLQEQKIYWAWWVLEIMGMDSMGIC